eukprot:g6287.t1
MSSSGGQQGLSSELSALVEAAEAEWMGLTEAQQARAPNTDALVEAAGAEWMGLTEAQQAPAPHTDSSTFSAAAPQTREWLQSAPLETPMEGSHKMFRQVVQREAARMDEQRNPREFGLNPEYLHLKDAGAVHADIHEDDDGMTSAIEDELTRIGHKLPKRTNGAKEKYDRKRRQDEYDRMRHPERRGKQPGYVSANTAANDSMFLSNLGAFDRGPSNSGTAQITVSVVADSAKNPVPGYYGMALDVQRASVGTAICRVKFVHPSGWAQNKGIRRGDQITGVGHVGKRFAELPLEQQMALLLDKKRPRVLTFLRNSGDVMHPEELIETDTMVFPASKTGSQKISYARWLRQDGVWMNQIPDGSDPTYDLATINLDDIVGTAE